MRRMYSESELRAFIKKYVRENGDDVVASLVGKDLSIEGLTSKGIANTGGLANIGDVAISGDLNVQGEGKGNIFATGTITGGEIIEDMSGYSYSLGTKENITQTNAYVGVAKTGNKITFAIAGQMTRTGSVAGDNKGLGVFTIPKAVGDKLIPHSIGSLDNVLRTQPLSFANAGYSLSNTLVVGIYKTSDTTISISVYGVDNLSLDNVRDFSFEVTFLLSENLAE